jgi:hypothetical protein
MPLSPLEAINRVNERVTVEVIVKAAKNCTHCSQIFLDSEEDHHDPKNFAVVCFAPPDKERPKEFSVKAGTGDYIHVWKKKAKE